MELNAALHVRLTSMTSSNTRRTFPSGAFSRAALTQINSTRLTEPYHGHCGMHEQCAQLRSSWGCRSLRAFNVCTAPCYPAAAVYIWFCWSSCRGYTSHAAWSPVSATGARRENHAPSLDADECTRGKATLEELYYKQYRTSTAATCCQSTSMVTKLEVQSSCDTSTLPAGSTSYFAYTHRGSAGITVRIHSHELSRVCDQLCAGAKTSRRAPPARCNRTKQERIPLHFNDQATNTLAVPVQPPTACH